VYRQAEHVRIIGEWFFVQCQELEDITFIAMLAEENGPFRTIEQLFRRFLARIPEALRDRISRHASIE
jgi:hypothetical protein